MANDFKAFAIGNTANVLSQADYVALSGLIAVGFTSGVAISEQLNKVWRQSSVISAVIGQYISDHSALDALDNADLAVLQDRLEMALRRGDLNYFTAGGGANALTIDPDPDFPSSAALVGVPLRIKITTTNTAAAALSVNGLTSHPIIYPDGSAVEGGALQAGAIVTLIYDGTSFQYIGDRIAAPPTLIASVSGLQSLPDNTDTTISFANTDFNTLTARGSTWNGVTFTVGANDAGQYLLTGQYVSASSDWLLGRAWFYINGGAHAAQTMGGNVAPAGNWQMQLTPSLIVRLRVGATISLGANQNNVSNTPQLVDVATRLQIVRLGS